MKKYDSVYLGRDYNRGISTWRVFREGESYPERTLLKAIGNISLLSTEYGVMIQMSKSNILISYDYLT